MVTLKNLYQSDNGIIFEVILIQLQQTSGPFAFGFAWRYNNIATGVAWLASKDEFF